MNLLLNILWLIFGGGLVTGLLWFVGGLLCCISIVFLPWAGAVFRIALYTFFPFGQEAVRRGRLFGEGALGEGPFGLLLNVIWLVVVGFWLALTHLALAAAYAVTIIGLPFAWAHFKLAVLALWPVGTVIVPTGEAPGAKLRRAP